jgi:hypothetical protein
MSSHVSIMGTEISVREMPINTTSGALKSQEPNKNISDHPLPEDMSTITSSLPLLPAHTQDLKTGRTLSEIGVCYRTYSTSMHLETNLVSLI